MYLISWHAQQAGKHCLTVQPFTTSNLLGGFTMRIRTCAVIGGTRRAPASSSWPSRATCVEQIKCSGRAVEELISSQDVDWVRWMMGKRCVRVSSFGESHRNVSCALHHLIITICAGSLAHFKKENKPQGASSRCLDCPVEESCAYRGCRSLCEGRLTHEILGKEDLSRQD